MMAVAERARTNRFFICFLFGSIVSVVSLCVVILLHVAIPVEPGELQHLLAVRHPRCSPGLANDHCLHFWNPGDVVPTNYKSQGLANRHVSILEERGEEAIR